MENLKAIVLDIDGTLTNNKKEITPKTLNALKKMEEQGIRLILASGRTITGMEQLAEELEMDKHHGLLVSSNGAIVSDVQTKEKLFSREMSAEEAKEVLEHLKKFKARPVVAYGDYMYVNDVFDSTINRDGEPWNVLQYESRSNNYILCEKKDLAEFIDFTVPKILTYGDPEYLQEHYEEIAAPFEGRLNSMFTAPFYYEFTAQNVDKAEALDAVIHQLGLKPENLMAFGDAQNDASIVGYAGCGVAMGNAVDSLKEIADEITLSNEEDGIAHTLYHHFPELFAKELEEEAKAA